MTTEELLTDEARAAVLRALFMIVVNDGEPASARVAAADRKSTRLNSSH